MKRFLILFAAACATCCQPAWADLRDWKAEYQRGLDAARAGDFEKAVEVIGLVNSETESNPSVVFNYALANARNGNTIKAALLFRLYLVMVPEATNAEAITKEISRLNEQMLANETDLFRRAIAAAREFPDVPPENDYSEPKKTDLFDTIARNADQVGNEEIAAEARELARQNSETHSYDYDPGSASERLRDNLADVGDLVGLVEAYSDFDDPEDYLDDLVAALDVLADFFPAATLTMLEKLPKELLTDDKYTVSDLVRLSLAENSKDPYFAHRQWNSDYLYFKEIELRDAILTFRPPEDWQPLARKILRRKPDSHEALAALTQSRKALKVIRDNGGNPFNPLGEWNNSVAVARLSLPIGNRDGISRARKQVINLSNDETDYSRMTDLLLHILAGNTSKALATLETRDDEEWDTWYQSIDNHFSRTVKVAARHLMRQNKFADAEDLILKGTVATDLPPMLRELAVQLEEAGETEEAARVREIASARDHKTRGGWQPASEDHKQQVEEWRKAAGSYKFGWGATESVAKAVENALNTEYCSSDTDAECIIDSLAYSAAQWGEARLAIKSLDGILPEHAVWLSPETRKRLARARDDALGKIGPTAREALSKWLAEEELDDSEKRFRDINGHRMAASTGNANSVRMLVGLYDPEEKGLEAPEVAAFLAAGLRRGDRYLHDHVTTSFKYWPKPLRLEFQRVLADEGLYQSGIDGVIGPGTRKAIDALFASAAPAN
ncbi:hypothetical protein [Labrenzia sp. VG12]|uniref:hypothetical protein n=1 Tax=Labrenzia sp. VG12 TaxID=2021862 RepID=UPI0012FE3665|nr:hypothetical protein [Labrenzia sp. VG12]